MIGQPYYGNTMGQPGYMVQPGYMGQPMMAPVPPPAPVIIVKDKPEATITNLAQEGDISHCPYCNQQTNNVMNRKAGCTTFLWCFCLLATTAGLFWVPFCCDGCKDTVVVCQRCCNVKTTVEANCC